MDQTIGSRVGPPRKTGSLHMIGMPSPRHAAPRSRVRSGRTSGSRPAAGLRSPDQRPSPGRRPHRLWLAGLVGVVALPLLAPVSQAAATQPSHNQKAAAGLRTQIGQTMSVGLDRGIRTITIAKPTGLQPNLLTATLTLADPSITGVTASLTVAGRLATTVALQNPRTVSIPLSPADFSDSTVTIGLVARVGQAQTGRCVHQDTAAVTLTSLAFRSPTPTTVPTTVGQFLTGPVSAARVEVGGVDSPLIRTAALTAVAALSHRFGSTAEVLVTTTPATPSPTTRVLRLVAGSGTVTSRIAADGALVLSGAPEGLVAAARALGSEESVLADAAATSGLSAAEPSASTTRTSTTLQELGAGSTPLTISASSQRSISIDQADFGGPVSGLTLHLVGTRSAVPDVVHPVVNISLNDALVDSFVLGEGGSFERTITVSDSALRSRNELRIDLPVTVDDSVCADVLDSGKTLISIDPVASVVTAKATQSLDAGFGRFPQTLRNVVSVAFDSGLSTSEGLVAAGRLVALLAAQQDAQLAVQETSIDQANLIVGATEATAKSLGSPLRLAAFRSVTGTFGVGVDGPFASLQAFETGGRDLLLLGGYGSSAQIEQQVDRLLTTARTSSYGWQSLSGDLMVSASGMTTPTCLSSLNLVPQQAQTQRFDGTVIWLGTAVLAVLALGAFGVLRRRRAARTGSGTQ